MKTQIEHVISDGQEQRDNLPLGTIGALLGVLLGMVLWVVIGQIGFIAGIAGYAIVFCSMKGYEMLGKGLSKAGIVICIILSFLAVIAAEVVSLGVTAYIELGPNAIFYLPELLQEPELITVIVKDLVIGYALSIWASYSFIKSIWKQAGRKQEPYSPENF